MIAAFAAGYALGLSLILAIGAQNAFVLRQGLRGSHVFAVCTFEDYERMMQVPDEYAPPDLKNFVPSEDLHSWMLDARGRAERCQYRYP